MTQVTEVSQFEMSADATADATADAEEDGEDLIIDAVEPQPEVKGFKGCLQSCCPIVTNAINDLRKVKVAEAVSKKANSLGMAMTNVTDGMVVSASPGAQAGNTNAGQDQDQFQDTVIERCDEIRKSQLDTYAYRYDTSNYIFAEVGSVGTKVFSCTEKVLF